MKTLFTISISLFIAVAINTQAALIQTKKDGNWSNTATWDGGVLPLVTDDVQIGNNDDITILPANSFTIAELWMGNGSSLTINGDLTIDSLHVNNNAELNVIGNLTILGGISISNNAELSINSTGNMDVQGDVTASNGASLTVDGGLSIDGDVTFSNNGSIDVGETGLIEIAGDFDSGGVSIEGTGPINVGGSVSGINSDDSQINGTLPIQLLSFDVAQLNGEVVVSWITATEENNDYFTIQRSEDGVTFYDIGYVNGAGNSNASLTYHFIDEFSIGYLSYYRLKQTDFDGKFEIFEAKTLEQEKTTKNVQSSLYPNPANKNDMITIHMRGLDKEYEDFIEVTIMDRNASIAFQKNVAINAVGEINECISASQLSTGIYIVWIQNESKVIRKKLIIN